MSPLIIILIIIVVVVLLVAIGVSAYFLANPTPARVTPVGRSLTSGTPPPPVTPPRGPVTPPQPVETQPGQTSSTQNVTTPGTPKGQSTLPPGPGGQLRIQEGGACTPNRGDCALGLYCGPDSKCHSGKEGDPCVIGGITCASGFACGTDSKCHVIPPVETQPGQTTSTQNVTTPGTPKGTPTIVLSQTRKPAPPRRLEKSEPEKSEPEKFKKSKKRTR